MLLCTCTANFDGKHRDSTKLFELKKGKGKIIIRTQQRFQGKSKYTYYLTFLCLVGSDIAIRNFGY